MDNRKEYRKYIFDYMIPVIPVIDASNSYAKMRDYLERSGDFGKIDDRFLRELCLYLDDLRIIKNIVNEFQIYNGLGESGVCVNLGKRD